MWQAITTPRVEHAMAGLLHDQVADEAVGCLDNDSVGAIATDALKEGGKAWTSLDGVGALTAAS